MREVKRAKARKEAAEEKGGIGWKDSRRYRHRLGRAGRSADLCEQGAQENSDED
jgi:hypothetical protein